MATKSFTLTEKQIQDLEKSLDQSKKETPAQYMRSKYRYDDCVIVIYESGKVVYQGKNIEPYFPKIETIDLNQYPQCGSDEVGTGDYFGPIVVVAAYVDEDTKELLNNLKIDDSKKINDQTINNIVPTLLEKVKYFKVIMNNEEYNDFHLRHNMVEIKAILHNRCYVGLSKLIDLPKLRVVDQFCDEKIYYHYLTNQDVIKNIHFETKAESKYQSVALSSMIARYYFLKEMEKMNQQYHLQFPLGAGQQVDIFGKEFIKKYDYKELNKVAKMHFQNTKKIQD